MKQWLQDVAGQQDQRISIVCVVCTISIIPSCWLHVVWSDFVHVAWLGRDESWPYLECLLEDAVQEFVSGPGCKLLAL